MEGRKAAPESCQALGGWEIAGAHCEKIHWGIGKGKRESQPSLNQEQGLAGRELYMQEEKLRLLQCPIKSCKQVQKGI